VKRYEVFDHTADIGVIARGKSIEEAFANAAYGLFDTMVYADRIEPVGIYRVSVSSPTLEDLLVDFLSELLYVFSVEFFVISDCDVKIKKNGEYRLNAVCKGEPYNREKHGIKTEVKAVTYHSLKVDEKKGYVRVLFDI